MVHIHSAIVGHHNLLEQTPQYLAHSVNGSIIVEFPFFQKLGQQVGRPLDGAGHQLREERNESEESDDVFGRFYLATIDIYGIRKGLESVKRNTNGKYHLQQKSICSDMEQLCKFRDEEVVILEQCKDAKVQDDVERRPSLCFFLCLCLPNEQSATP